MSEVLGIGVDMVRVDRLRAILEGDDYTGLVVRWFTPAERDYCLAKSDPAPHLAARFAAKEAFLKALGYGLGPGIVLTEIGVVNGPTGKPSLELAGATARLFASQGGERAHLSLSHDGNYAQAMVVLSCRGPGGDGDVRVPPVRSGRR
ncbi:MAG: holo-ACP synthase [bacterium]